mmetsp:Transcript_22711/g.72651  ORF Transcript_22711/g.72651 Transcript_22711/m.72651 type:complete len:205 (+) Transcript_22711:804-1418(+)
MRLVHREVADLAAPRLGTPWHVAEAHRKGGGGEDEARGAARNGGVAHRGRRRHVVAQEHRRRRRLQPDRRLRGVAARDHSRRRRGGRPWPGGAVHHHIRAVHCSGEALPLLPSHGCSQVDRDEVVASGAEQPGWRGRHVHADHRVPALPQRGGDAAPDPTCGACDDGPHVVCGSWPRSVCTEGLTLTLCRLYGLSWLLLASEGP